MASYLHGTYGVLKDAVIQSAEEASTAAVIIGTLPVHLLPDYDGTVGTPLLMSNASAKETYGYVSDWDDFTLCEAVQAFFAGGNNIGPIYAINVLDPDTHRAATSVEASVTFTGGVAVLDDSLAIAKTTADQNFNVLLCQKSCQRTVTGAIAADHFRCNHLTVFNIINFKRFSMSKMLEYLSVLKSYCNFHVILLLMVSIY